MDHLGATAGAIALAWLLSAAIEAMMSPFVGRVSDRRGRIAPSLAGLAGGAVIMAALPWPAGALLLGGLIVLAGPLVGLLWTPAMALVSDGAEPLGVDYALAYSIVNLAWGLGQVIGGAGSSQLADAAGDRAPYLLLSGTCVATFAVLRTAAARRAASVSTSLRTG
jgi:MFS family permease